MSTLPSKSEKVKAVLCSDIHLSDTPPVFRSNEPDCFEAMARHLRQIGDAADYYQCPIICGGDVFDRWNPSPALINFALDELPKMYAVPGQHDLPYHRYSDIQSSAYWTMVKSGKILNLEYGKPVEEDGLVLHGFPWNSELKECEATDLCLHIAVVHRYIWMDEETSYVGASQTNHIESVVKQLKNFNVMLFGDNHKGFTYLAADGSTVINTGGFMRRKRDERSYKPSFALLYADGKVERWALDCKSDVYLSEDNQKEQLDEERLNLDGFISELNDLGTDALNFKSALQLYCENNEVDEQTQSIIMGASDEDR